MLHKKHCSVFNNLFPLAVNLLEMTGYKGDAAQLVAKVVADGSAMERFRRMLLVQGVSEETLSGLVEGRPVLPTAKYTTEFRSHSSGKSTSNSYIYEFRIGLAGIQIRTKKILLE